tara:strand:+ start:3349 stop:4626 length:1278 start_codon:yes stop_codon:yes gene_type:complete
MNNFKFNTISRNKEESNYPIEQNLKGFIKYGVYNDFPEYLIYLFNNSAINNTAINATVDAIVGEGLVCDQSHLLDIANQDGESWNDIFKKTALDYKLYGGYAWEVIWSKDRTRIAEVYHVDYSWLRAKEKNMRGKIPGYYISDEWAEKYRFGGSGGGMYNQVASSGISSDLPYLPAFNPRKNQEEPKQIFVYCPYRPGQKYYPLPDYVGALKVIDLDSEIDTFHISNIRNGLSPSLAITTFTNADPDERQEIEQMLRLQYQGAGNAGAMMYMDVDSPENAPIITPITNNGSDDYYISINQMVTEKILTAHRITSPEIFGIMTPGKLGGKDEVTDAYLLFINTVVRPYQQTLLSEVENFMHLMYPSAGEFSVGVQQTKLFSDGEEEVDVVTSVESEAGEDDQLEVQIEQADGTMGVGEGADSDGVI